MKNFLQQTHETFKSEIVMRKALKTQSTKNKKREKNLVVGNQPCFERSDQAIL